MIALPISIGILTALLYLAIAIASPKRSSRFPKLAAPDGAVDTVSNPHPVDFTSELRAVKRQMAESKFDDASLELWEILKRMRASDVQPSIQASVADMLVDVLQHTRKSDQANAVAAYLSKLTASSKLPDASARSLFAKALIDDPDLVLATIETIRALRGRLRPFVSAYLMRLWLATLIGTCVGAVLGFLLGSVFVVGDPKIVFLTFCIVAPLCWVIYEIYVITTTTFELLNGTLVFRRGGLSRRTTIYEVYRIHDIVLYRSLINRFSGDSKLDLVFDKEQKPVKLRGWVKKNEIERLAFSLREVSRALRAIPAIKGILT